MRKAVRVSTHFPAFVFGQRSRANRGRASRYGTTILMVAVALFIQIFAGVCYPVRKLLFEDSGRKLAHVEMQICTGQSISEALPESRKEHSL